MKNQNEKLVKSRMMWDSAFDSVANKLAMHFQENIAERVKETPDAFEESPNELISIVEYEELFEFIMNHDYWVREWSNYLLAQLVNLVYHDE